MTGRPAAFSALALASTASVADSAMEPIRWEIRCVVGAFTRACSHARGCGRRRGFASGAGPRVQLGPGWLTTAMLTPAHNLTDCGYGAWQRSRPPPVGQWLNW